MRAGPTRGRLYFYGQRTSLGQRTLGANAQTPSRHNQLANVAPTISSTSVAALVVSTAAAITSATGIARAVRAARATPAARITSACTAARHRCLRTACRRARCADLVRVRPEHRRRCTGRLKSRIASKTVQTPEAGLHVVEQRAFANGTNLHALLLLCRADLLAYEPSMRHLSPRTNHGPG